MSGTYTLERKSPGSYEASFTGVVDRDVARALRTAFFDFLTQHNERATSLVLNFEDADKARIEAFVHLALIGQYIDEFQGQTVLVVPKNNESLQEVLMDEHYGIGLWPIFTTANTLLEARAALQKATVIAEQFASEPAQ